MIRRVAINSGQTSNFTAMKTNLLPSADQKRLTEAGERERQASANYKYFANCAQSNGLFGFQKFFDKESADELTHYDILRDFANDMGMELSVPMTTEPELEAENGRELLAAGYKMEKDLLDFYSDWHSTTKNAAVQVMLIKFIKIQTKSVGGYADMFVQYDKYGEALFDINLNK